MPRCRKLAGAIILVLTATNDELAVLDGHVEAGRGVKPATAVIHQDLPAAVGALDALDVVGRVAVVGSGNTRSRTLDLVEAEKKEG